MSLELVITTTGLRATLEVPMDIPTAHQLAAAALRFECEPTDLAGVVLDLAFTDEERVHQAAAHLALRKAERSTPPVLVTAYGQTLKPGEYVASVMKALAGGQTVPVAVRAAQAFLDEIDETGSAGEEAQSPFLWIRWKAQADAAGMREATAWDGRALIREAYQHQWAGTLGPSIDTVCGWSDEGAAMLAFGLAHPELAAAAWEHLVEEDAGNNPEPPQPPEPVRVLLLWVMRHHTWPAQWPLE